MIKRIVERSPVLTRSDLPESTHPVIRRICEARNIHSQNDLNHRLQALPRPELLSGIDNLVGHLTAAIEEQSRLLILADFDADGATSCAVAKRGLEMLGLKQVLYTVPDRFQFGYGLTPEIVEVICRSEPDIVLTVDNGISSLEGVRAARARGIKVLITDHHIPGNELPDADAIVNPNLPDDPFPSKSLAGVGVVFYVLSALRKSLRDCGRFRGGEQVEPNLADLLDLVALGTVADVVELDFTNRVLVHQGIQRIRSGRSHHGLNALLQVAGRSREELTSSDLGFALGPRLNAAGRLENMSLGIECLLSNSWNEALAMAQQLDSLNQERREIEARMKQQAMELLTHKQIDDQPQKQPGICLYDESWHQGVVGIIASRIKERFNRPVIAFASAGDGTLKGSGRSVPGIHMRDILSEIAALNPKLLSKFGGHAMAAGLTIELADYPEFTEQFSEIIARNNSESVSEPTIYTDGRLDSRDMTIDFAQQLSKIGPWGQGFPEPQFVGEFEVLAGTVLKEKHVKFSLAISGCEQVFDGIAFFAEQPEGWLQIKKIKLVYRLSINRYRKVPALQLIVDYMEALNTESNPA